jgi:hypothetical protein
MKGSRSTIAPKRTILNNLLLLQDGFAAEQTVVSKYRE